MPRIFNSKQTAGRRDSKFFVQDDTGDADSTDADSLAEERFPPTIAEISIIEPPTYQAPPTAEMNQIPKFNLPGYKPPAPAQPTKTKLKFHCQQAHGSPTGIITGFTNVSELYQKIADCYDLDTQEILFCTLNTHKLDMNSLLGGRITPDDFIFAHIKGQPKEVEVVKSEDSLGLILTENGSGYSFIKGIKEGSLMDKNPLISVGDHIEKINGENLVGTRHFEIAKKLKEIQKGATLLLRTVEPIKSGKKYNQQEAADAPTPKVNATESAPVNIPSDVVNLATGKINDLLDSFMGINDAELSQTIWEIGSKVDNPSDFAMNIEDSDLEMFGFSDDFVFDLWGAISDAKRDMISKSKAPVAEPKVPVVEPKDLLVEPPIIEFSEKL